MSLLWNGTAESVIDLKPPGFYSSSADGVSGAYQVGSARPAANSYDHVTLWMGTAASAFDLHSFVVAADPSFLSSYALAIFSCPLGRPCGFTLGAAEDVPAR
jgi:hypothetical protein